MKHLKNHWTSKAIHSPITFTLRFCVWSAMRKIYVFVLFCFFVEKFWRNQWKTVILEILGNMDWIKQLVPWTLCSLISIHVYETLDMFWKVTISASFKKMYVPKLSEGHLVFNLMNNLETNLHRIFLKVTISFDIFFKHFGMTLLTFWTYR